MVLKSLAIIPYPVLQEVVEAVFQYLPTHRDQPNLRLAFHEEFPKNTCLFDIELKMEVLMNKLSVYF